MTTILSKETLIGYHSPFFIMSEQRENPKNELPVKIVEKVQEQEVITIGELIRKFKNEDYFEHYLDKLIEHGTLILEKNIIKLKINKKLN